MHNIDKGYLSQLARETGFIRDTLEKVIRLAQVLHFLNTEPALSNRLALKGGTAINMLFFPLPRLSVDIDLDYLGGDAREEMLQSRQAFTTVIMRYMEGQGYRTNAQSKTPYSLDSWVFSYTNLGGNNDTITIEINYSLRSHILAERAMPLTLPFLAGSAPILCLNAIEIYAGKINALLSRAAARDLFDVVNMITSDLIGESQRALLRKACVFYAAISSKETPSQLSLSAIDGITGQDIKTALLPLLPRSTHFDLEEAKRLSKAYLSQLLQLTASEAEFLTLFRQKRYRPDLLFAEPAIVGRIEAHPMALWKIREERR